MDCKVVFDPAQPDRFFLDMKVYHVVKAGPFTPTANANSEVWRGIYLAVEVKPRLDTGSQIISG